LGMERKPSYKPNSKAQKRLKAYSNSVDRKEPFFPTIELNEAYNPPIQLIDQAFKRR
jgi:hypothetical protein